MERSSRRKMSRSGRFGVAFAALLAGPLAGLSSGGTAVAAPPELGPRPVSLPWSFAPDLEGVEAVTRHAAGLGFMPGFELGLVANVGLAPRALSLDGGTLRPVAPSAFGALVGGRLGPLGLGVGAFAQDSGDGLGARFDVGLAWRFGDVASVGARWTLHNDRSNATIDRYGAFSLSTTLRPIRWLALAGAVEHADTPVAAGAGGAPSPGHDGPLLRLSLGLRPFGEAGTLGLEGARHLGDLGFWQAGLAARVWLVPGLAFGAHARYTAHDDDALGDRVDLGLHLAFSQGGMALETSADLGDVGGEAAPGLSVLFRSRAERLPSLAAPDNIILRVRIDGPIAERPVQSLLGGASPGFGQWVKALDAVSRDPDVAAVFFQIGGAPGWAQCWELRQSIARLRARGKKVYAGLVIADMRAMYLASAADEVWLHAAGGMTLTGLAVTQSYYFELLKKIGVEAEFIAFEEYKSFPEVATRTGPSEPARTQSRRILGLIDVAWKEAVAAGRRLEPASVDDVLANGPQSMHDARAAGLVDALVETDAYSDLLRERHGDFTLVSRYAPWPRGSKRWGTREHVAVVPVVGSIVDGSSAGALPIPVPFVGGTTTGDRSFIEALEAAVNDPDAVGVVVRVDSGGGSVTASDRMHRAIRTLSKRKPIAVSFGGSAASGGYYLAAGSERILSTPLSVTGSIGIFTGKANLAGLYAAIGVDHHTERTTERADMLSGHRGFTDAERDRAQDVLRAYYDRFLGVVAEGRKMDLDAVRELAKGRVWLGSDALPRGLVDAEGGLLDAMAFVAEQAGRDLADLDVVYRGSLGALSGLQRLAAVVFDLPDTPASAPSNPHLAALGSALAALSQLDIGAPLALMPFTLDID
jgi:protease-4